MFIDHRRTFGTVFETFCFLFCLFVVFAGVFVLGFVLGVLLSVGFCFLLGSVERDWGCQIIFVKHQNCEVCKLYVLVLWNLDFWWKLSYELITVDICVLRTLIY